MWEKKGYGKRNEDAVLALNMHHNSMYNRDATLIQRKEVRYL